MSEPKKLVIEVFSDLVCPWCWIGDSRLQKALQAEGLQEGKDVEVRWNPFQLQPDRERDEKTLRQHLGEKYGSSRVDGMLSHVESVACEDGLCIRFDTVKNSPNTAQGHRLVLWVAQLVGGEKAIQVSRALFSGYFEKGWDLNSDEDLLRALEGTDLPKADARSFLSGTQAAEAVEQTQKQAAAYGINGVPFFILGGKYAISGAQPLEVFSRAIRQALTNPS